MAEQEQWNAWIAVLNEFCYGVQIFYDCLFVFRVKESVIFLLYHAFAMTTVVMNHTDISMTGKIIHKIKIPFFMFRHAMGKLNNPFWG